MWSYMGEGLNTESVLKAKAASLVSGVNEESYTSEKMVLPITVLSTSSDKLRLKIRE